MGPVKHDSGWAEDNAGMGGGALELVEVAKELLCDVGEAQVLQRMGEDTAEMDTAEMDTAEGKAEMIYLAVPAAMEGKQPSEMEEKGPQKCEDRLEIGGEVKVWANKKWIRKVGNGQEDKSRSLWAGVANAS